MSNTIQNTTDYSTLFNSLSTSSTSNSTTSSMFDCLSSTTSSSYSLADYASLKSGSYYKLAKAYYNEIEDDSTDTESSTTTQKIRTDAVGLKNAADALAATGTNSLFEKVKSTDENGKVTEDYNRDKIYESTKDFVDQYNSVIKSAGESDITSVLRNTLNMVKMTSKNSAMLEKLGITINDDNTLSIDEEKNKAADITTMKAMFSGIGSYADSVSNYASRINNYAVNSMQKNNTYTSTGTYSTESSTSSSGSILDGYL